MGDSIPTPNWFTIDDDGGVSATWCHGTQGDPNSWRITMLQQPGEGFHVFKTYHHGTHNEHGDDAGVWLRCLLDVGWGSYRYATPVTDLSDADLAFQRDACARIWSRLDSALADELAWLKTQHTALTAEAKRRERATVKR